jgi:hypothetical protein
MDINQAVSTVEAFVESYAKSTAGWKPTEVEIRPSGDEQNTIKIWINFGASVKAEDLTVLKQQFLDALEAAHPEVRSFSLTLRAEAF